jgi:hypothetical protein
MSASKALPVELYVASMAALVLFASGCKESTSLSKAKSATKVSSPLKRPTKFDRRIDKTEKVTKEVSAAFSQALVIGLKKGDLSLIPKFATSDFSAHFIPATPLRLTRNSTISVRTLSGESAVLGIDGFMVRLQGLISRLTLVQQSGFRIFETLLAPNGDSVYIKAHWDFAGTSKEGDSHRWNMTVQASLVRDAPTSPWKLRQFDVIKGDYAVSRGRKFQDVAGFTGLKLHETKQNIKHSKELIDLRQLTQSGGVTVLDFNSDDYWDVLVTRKNRVAGLFVNDGQGGFDRMEFPPLQDAREIARFYLSVDLDNDGENELVSTHVKHLGKQTASLGLFRVKGTEVNALDDRLKFTIPIGTRDMNFEGLTACDVNGDDLLDLVVVGYSHWESLRDNFNLVDGRDGLQNLVFINHGKLTFSEESDARGVTGTQYSYVAECVDFDGDSDADIFIGNDYGQNVFYENDGNGQFVEDKSHPFSKAHGFSMGIARADYDNTGHYAVSISNMYSHAGRRIVPLVSDLSNNMHQVVQNYARGNALYEHQDGVYKDVARARGVELAEWAWGNVFFDVDNDADKDLYVVNGFTSHQDPTAPDW